MAIIRARCRAGIYQSRIFDDMRKTRPSRDGVILDLEYRGQKPNQRADGRTGFPTSDDRDTRMTSR